MVIMGPLPKTPEWLHERVLLDELANIAHGQPLFAGDTLSHATANECVDRGWAKRDERSHFCLTLEGAAYLRAHQEQHGRAGS